MKLKEGTLMTYHLNVFQSIVNQLALKKKVIDDEIQASLLLCLILDSWKTSIMTISNFVPNGALSMELAKGNLFNEETKRKAYDKKKCISLHHKKQRKKHKQRIEMS